MFGKIFSRRLFGVFVCTVFILAMPACKKRTDIALTPSASISQNNIVIAPDKESKGISFINMLPYPGQTKSEFIPQRTASVKEKQAINEDTVGWVKVDNTVIDDVIVWYPNDQNAFYLRRNFDKQYSQYGIYYADFRCKFGDKWEDLSQNTTIYGHSMNDNPDGRIFSQLKKYLDEDFAKNNPYIFFSTPEQDLAFEIFAVSYATTHLPYNNPNPTVAQFNSIIEEIRARSLYNYDMEIVPNDKVITLSTCCYNFTSSYPNDYRYIIMAKLVHEDTLKLTASLTKNPSPKAP